MHTTRRIALGVSAPWALASIACAVVVAVTVAESFGRIPNYSSWLAVSMAAGYSISGSV